MATSWSNPIQDPHTAAALAPDALHFADIGPVVGAIMRMREQQAAQKQQAQKEMIAGVGDAVKGAYSGYEKYQGHEDEKLLGDYIQNYQTGKQGGTTGWSIAQDENDKLLEQMSPSTRIKAQLWQMEQDKAHDTSNMFVTDPQTGERYYKTSHGIQPVSGHGGSNYDYFEEGGQVFKKNPKNGVITTVPTSEAEAYKKSKGQESDIGTGYGVDPSTLESTDVTTPGNVRYMQGDKQVSTEDAKKNPDKTTVVFPDGRTVPYKANIKGKDYGFQDVVPYIQKAQADKKAVEAVPGRFQSRASSAFGGGTGTHVNDQAEKIKAAYQAGQISREDAKAQLQALGMD